MSTEQLTPAQLWKIIEQIDWKNISKNINSCAFWNNKSKELKETYKDQFKEVAMFVYMKYDELRAKIDAEEQDREYLYLDVGDDTCSDLIYEVISRGKTYYDNITLDILAKMYAEHDYTESFGYLFNFYEDDEDDEDKTT